MKVFLYAFTLVFLLKVNATENQVKESWLKFKQQYGKIYNSTSEHQERYDLFKKHYEFVTQHNLGYREGKSLYELEINELADLKEEEIVKYFMGLQEEEGFMDLREFNENYSSLPNFPDHAPDSVDWRSFGAVTEVKKQNKCGSCWAFSAIASLEGQQFLKTGQLIELSEQNLVDCVEENSGCNGGQIDKAYSYIQHNGGVDTELAYPYLAQQHTCNFSYDFVGSKVQDYVRFGSIDENVLKNAVAFIGPISVVVKGFPKSFHQYKQGIYNDPTCNREHHTRHAVTAVGYGSENGVDYWILKNSWGPEWGEGGFMRLVRNQNNFCLIGKRCYYPLV